MSRDAAIAAQPTAAPATSGRFVDRLLFALIRHSLTHMCMERTSQSRYATNRSGFSRLSRKAAMNCAETAPSRSEEHTSELQSLMRISYAVFCLKKKNKLIYI